MPKIGGLEYSYNELTRMSGLSKASLFARYQSNPDITLTQLLAPPKTRATKFVVICGEEIPLYVWAHRNKADVHSVYNRWNNGIRDPYILVRGLKGRVLDLSKLPLPPITDEMIAWLDETEFARKGQPDEWEIACDLIGIAPDYAEALRMFMEGRNDTKR